MGLEIIVLFLARLPIYLVGRNLTEPVSSAGYIEEVTKTIEWSGVPNSGNITGVLYNGARFVRFYPILTCSPLVYIHNGVRVIWSCLNKNVKVSYNSIFHFWQITKIIITLYSHMAISFIIKFGPGRITVVVGIAFEIFIP